MPALSFEQIRERLAARFGPAVGPTVAAKDLFVVVDGAKVLEIARFLHDDPEVALDYLIDETAVDYPAESLIRVVYHLWSMRHQHGFKMKVELARDAPELASVEPVWRAANWLEREIYDLFGVRYLGHPDLRRLFMPADWPGHPLRKDWQEQGGYHGIGNERLSALTVLAERDQKARALAPKPAAAPKPEAPAASAEAKPAAAAPVEAKPAAAAPEPAAAAGSAAQPEAPEKKTA